MMAPARLRLVKKMGATLTGMGLGLFWTLTTSVSFNATMDPRPMAVRCAWMLGWTYVAVVCCLVMKMLMIPVKEPHVTPPKRLVHGWPPGTKVPFSW